MKESKRKRGRSPLTEQQKKRHRAERVKKRKQERKQQERNSQMIVQSTKSQISEGTNKLILSEEIESAIKPQTEFIPKSGDLVEISKEQLLSLTDRIQVLEEEQTVLESRLKKLIKVSNQWQAERSLIKELIKMDQDIIYENEQKFEKIDSKNFEYTADRTNIVRSLFEFLTGRPDEILTDGRIIRHEIKYRNRKEQLVKIDSELADVLITIMYNDDLRKMLDVTISELREIRIEVGSNFRLARKAGKNNLLSIEQQQVKKIFSENLSKLNEATMKFKTMISESQNYIREQYKQFDTMQKNLLNQGKEYQFDEMVSNLENKMK